MTFINLACGTSFVSELNWINLDYSSTHPSVIKANLLNRLPIDDNLANAVYSSHFIEHIPRSKVAPFLQECYRVLDTQGIIRLVLPDWENLCQEYLTCRAQGEHDKADFTVLEMLDQCVRAYPGGLLGDYFDYLKKNADNHYGMIEYIKLRCGEDLNLAICKSVCSPDSQEEAHVQKKLSKVISLIMNPRKLVSYFQSKFINSRIKLGMTLLPQAFREQNVSYASIGEKHAWMWDFYTLGQELERAGFHSIKRLSFDRTDIDGFPLIPLDMTPEGLPRKGESSMYIEAKK